MIVIDTNVISEAMRRTPNPEVMVWYAMQARASLFTTTVTVAEILAGIDYLPVGRRKSEMQRDAQLMFEDDFSGRVLPFDLTAADHYADISARRRRLGPRMKPLDAQIAAIARANGMAVATRNVADFEDCGVDLINPWEA